MADARLSAQLPEFKVTKPIALHDPVDCKSETKTLKNGVVINLEIPCHNTVLQVEDMIREFAARGEYLGWDEFLEDGCYNRRLLISTHMIVAKTSTGTLDGAALFGGCRFNRSKKIANARLYLFVTPSHRELGIGGALFDKSMKIIKDLGYEGVSSDLFAVATWVPPCCTDAVLCHAEIWWKLPVLKGWDLLTLCCFTKTFHLCHYCPCCSSSEGLFTETN